MEQKKRITILFILPVLALLLLTMIYRIQPARAATLTVNTLTDETNGCAVSDCSLREAIAAANDGDIIDFSVSGTIDISGNGQLVVSKSLTISSNVPITISGNDAVRVFKVISNTTSTTAVTFSGLTIAHGRDNSSDCFVSCGGGMYIGSNTAVTLTHSHLISNSANHGGAIYNDGRSGITNLTIYDSILSSNSVSLGGGAIYNDGYQGNSNLTLLRSSVVNNYAADYGGGIANNENVNLRISDSTFSHNSANIHHGGAIFSDVFNSGAISVAITSSTFYSNSAPNGIGGGIYNNNYASNLSLTLNNSTLSNNFANEGGAVFQANQNGDSNLAIRNSSLSSNSANAGGAVFNYNISGGSAVATFTNSTLFDNSASDVGGAVFNISSSGFATVTVHNSTFSANSADTGGGIYNNNPASGNSSLTLNNSTFSGNLATNGGGIYNEDGAMHLRNSLIAHSTNGDCVSLNGEPATNLNNLIEDGSCHPDLLGDPSLGPLADNGGETLTHMLLPDSPAIDAGDNTTCLPFDQRGVPRPQIAACDIGSVEGEVVGLSVSVAGDGIGDVSSTPSGIDCGLDCSETFFYGTAVTLTATTITGTTFSGWSSACTGSGNCLLDLLSSTTVTATFSLESVSAFDHYLPVIVRSELP